MPKSIRKTYRKRRRFTEKQKTAAVQQALDLMKGENRSLYSTATELGIGQTSLKRWLDRHRETDPGSFIPVEMTITSSEKPLVKTSQGVQVTGLTIEGVAKLLRLLAE